MNAKKMNVDGVDVYLEDENARKMISDEYDPTNGTYEVGDTCINNNKLYICNTDIDTPEDFDSTKWDADTIGHYCTELKSNLTELTTYSETTEKVIGEWVNGKPLYRLVISGTTHATAGTIKALKTFSDYADLEVKNIYGTIKSTTSDNKYPYLPCNYYESSSSYAYTFMRGTDSSLSVKTSYTSRPIEVVIEYTRVSD